jgi:hypothetical protein
MKEIDTITIKFTKKYTECPEYRLDIYETGDILYGFLETEDQCYNNILEIIFRFFFGMFYSKKENDIIFSKKIIFFNLDNKKFTLSYEEFLYLSEKSNLETVREKLKKTFFWENSIDRDAE